MARKKVLLTIPFGISARNILRTDVYRLLQAECDIVIVSKLASNKDFIAEFAAPNVRFYAMPALRGRRAVLRTKIQDLWLFYYGKKTSSETLMRHRARLRRENRKAYCRTLLATWLLDRFRLWAALRLLTRKFIFNHRYYAEVLGKESPDIVLSMSPLVTEEDLATIYCAKKRRIPSVGFPNSWDSIPKESNPWVLPDKLMVWNDIMKQQAQHFLGYKEQDVFVVGVPQYDEYLFKTSTLPEADYKAQKRIPSGFKIITYTCGHPKFFVDEEDFIKDLISMVEKGTFGDVVLILRLHPRYNIEQYKKIFSHRPQVFFDEANAASAATYADDWSREDSITQYVNLIYHSDVVINLASTVTLDAAIFNRPVINVAYDLKPASYWFANARYYESAHYKHITASGGVRIARSRAELIEYIKMYLTNPALDRAGRQRIVTEQCYQLDGKACERVVQALYAIMGEGK